MPEPDDLLHDRLREVLARVESPPRHLIEAAKASLEWRTVDADLAELLSDSADDPAVALRSNGAPHLLTFSSGDTVVVLEVGPERQSRRVIGQIISPAAAHVEVRHSGGVISTAADVDGRFRASAVSPGPISVSCRFDEPDRAPIVTSWVAI